MFSEILKVVTKLDEKSMKQLTQNLQSRFTKIAKGFGKGMANAFKGGGIAGIGLALIDKVLNPLKEVQEAIDRTLKSSDDIATNAAQFNTTSGKLAKLIALGEGSGLEQEGLFTLMSKFQTAVAEQKADPTKQSAVQNFTGEDTAEEFFNFIQSLKTMEKNNQILVQQAVFGEKQILKMSEFLNQDFGKQFETIGLGKFDTGKLTQSIDGISKMSDLTDALAANRKLGDLSKKGSLINEGMVRSKDQQERVALEKENQRISNYESLVALSMSAEKITGLVDQGVGLLATLVKDLLPTINNLAETVKKFIGGSTMKTFLNFFKRDN